MKRVKLTEDFDLVGYPYVPFSYSSMKDFEKIDGAPESVQSGEWREKFQQRNQMGQHRNSYHSVQ